MQRFVLALFLLLAPVTYAQTVSSVAISPQGAVLQSGSTLQFSVTCTYSNGSTDDCTLAGGATWTSTSPSTFSIASNGLLNMSTDPGAGNLGMGFVLVSAGDQSDKAGVFDQHPGDTWYDYITPDYSVYSAPPNVVVGSTIALGEGVVINYSGEGGNGSPMQTGCSWSSSNTSVATVNRLGEVTGVSPGSVTITCGLTGNGVFGSSSISGWVSGNSIQLSIVAGGTSNTTWYIRPNGGTPFTNATATPNGQCDGKHDADYPGSGVDQPCAFGNIRYLWTDEVSYDVIQWVISGGDTVIVRQNTNGYNMGLDQAPTSGWSPINCINNQSGCFMPSIPSGTATQHTRILGENYASCHDDSAKTKLLVSNLSYMGINVTDSQFVDVACFEITDEAACTGNGNYTNVCSSTSDAGGNGIIESALTASVNYTDLFIHGLMHDGINGATGIGVNANYVHIRAMPDAGINMDDSPWETTNISVAGGFTLTNSITEFTGCVEQYPITLNYPYIECRDQSTGGYGDGLGTASTTGDWTFDGDIWRYNFQDGLDLLHSGMHNLSVTNSQSYGNDGQAYKVGSGDAIVFQNNIAMVNCNRIAYTIGDEPASAIVPGVSTCRAAGDGVIFSFTNQGTYYVQDNTFVGYNATMFSLECELGWDACPNAGTTFENNVVMGYQDPLLSTGDPLPGLFYENQASMPINGGFVTRDHNLYYNVRYCPTTLFTGEICNTADPQFTVEPPSPISAESALDSFNFAPTAASPLIGAGVAIAGITTDINGTTRSNPPTIGAIETPNSSGTPSLTSTTATLSSTATSVVAGQSVTFTAAVAPVNGVTPTGTVTFTSGTTSLGSITLSSGSASVSTASLASGTYTIIGSYSGDSVYSPETSNSISLTVRAATSTTTPPPPVTTSPLASTLTLKASPNPVTAGQAVTITGTVTGNGSVVPTGTVTVSAGGSAIGSGQLSSGVATISTSSLAAGTYTLSASYSGDSTYAASSSSQVSLTVNPAATTSPSTVVSISVGQPTYGFNVIPGSTRRVFANVTNGTTNQVTWAVTSGSGTISSTSGSWVDVTAPASGSSCQISGSSSQYSVASSTQFTVTATSVDDTTKSTNITFNVCLPTVEISVVPFYRAVYSNQPVDLQSLMLGTVDPSVHWTIASQPKSGDGSLTDTTSRDTVFTATVAGRYQITATSQTNSQKTASAIVYVTGNSLPYRVTPNLTEPIDCTVDPSAQGTVYDVGPSQTYTTLASVPFPTIAAGSTVRVHNEDTTGLHPTTYYEYVQILQAGTAEQPIRICGVPDSVGNLPILDGTNATGRSDDSANVAGAGLITLYNSSNQGLWPNYSASAYVVVEGLQLRNAVTGNSFTAPGGSQGQWSNSSSGIEISQGQNTVFVGDDINTNSNGVVSAFSATSAWGSSDINVLWEGNHIHNNGVSGSSTSHQMDLQAWGEVVQFNRIDDYVSGGLGANIKSRGIQGIIRYNYLGDGPARQIDMVDVQNATAMMSFEGLLNGGASSVYATTPNDPYPVDRIAAEQEAWNSHYVYGNIYQNSISNVPIHFGEELSGGEPARKGSLYWYNNTFYQKACSTCSAQSWTMFDTGASNGQFLPQTEFQTVQMYNDVVWMDSSSSPAFQFNNYDAFIAAAGKNLLTTNWGSNNMAGGSGTGWVASANSDAYQNAQSLSLHVTGFTSENLLTANSIPFDANTWTLNSAVAGQQSVPTAVCQMPVRFAYLPQLGYVVPRTDSPNVGATDTAAQTATQMNAVAGAGRYHTRYSTCN
jgi:Bacterial Ig-like domain (group 3)/Bacterial Ig-like domain (group 2)